MNRGKLSLQGLAEKALELNAEKVVVVERWRGGPGKIEFYKLEENGLQPTPPLIYLRGVKLQREFQTVPMRRRIKSVAIAPLAEASEESEMLERALSSFFSIPIVSSLDEYGDYNAIMQIAAEPSGLFIVTFKVLPENLEIGPRLTISRLSWDFIYEG